MRKGKLSLLVLGILFCAADALGVLRVGSGIYDITGPASDLATLGYAAPTPKTAGIHQRLWARAFYIQDPSALSVAIVVVDSAMTTHAVQREVVAQLKARYGNEFGYHNVLITATHTHSAPGGHGHSRFYNIPTKGFSAMNFRIIADGIVRAIEKARASAIPAQAHVSVGELSGANINRSLPAYVNNPVLERSTYRTATDEDSIVLKFVGENGVEIGMINWFPVHATSIEKDNHLISGDNKGYAAFLFEKWKQTNPQLDRTFVGAFANSNAGDVSPNTEKDLDGDGDWDCVENSNLKCAENSGKLQFDMAKHLYESAGEPLSAKVDARHAFTDFSKLRIEPRYSGRSDWVQTCSGAIGLAMLAGSEEDGPGVGWEGRTCANGGPLARVLCLRPVSRCHGDKPVVLATGRHAAPWTSEIIPHQLIRLGELVIVAAPGELTTMSGRRIRQALLQQLAPLGIRHVILSSYSNDYTGYIATPEEYQKQHYEGGHTLFGRWTLAGYKKVYAELAHRLMQSGPVTVGPLPHDTQHSQGVAQMASGFDSRQGNLPFGHWLRAPKPRIISGESQSLSYVCANLNNNPRIQGSFFTIEKMIGDKWTTVANDADWATQLHWSRRGSVSQCKIVWDTHGVDAGSYRVRVAGDAYLPRVGLQPFQATSATFIIQ